MLQKMFGMKRENVCPHKPTSLLRVAFVNSIETEQTQEAPLIPRNSGNVFHDQALIQLASTYESLQLGDSREAVTQTYQLGKRIFGVELFDRAIRVGRLSGATA